MQKCISLIKLYEAILCFSRNFNLRVKKYLVTSNLVLALKSCKSTLFIDLFVFFSFINFLLERNARWRINWQRKRRVTDSDCMLQDFRANCTGKHGKISILLGLVESKLGKEKKNATVTHYIGDRCITRESLLDKSNLFRFELSVIARHPRGMKREGATRKLSRDRRFRAIIRSFP